MTKKTAKKTAKKKPKNMSQRRPGTTIKKTERKDVKKSSQRSSQKKPALNPDPFKPYRGRYAGYHELPAMGRDQVDIFRELSAMSREENKKWKDGRVSGTFYHAGADHLSFLGRVFTLFSHVNVLQVDLCPSMQKFESEIVSMTSKMLNGEAASKANPEDQVCGSVTFGGTESILMPVKVYRDRAREEKGITSPELIIPRTAHPAFIKACHYFGLKLVIAPVSGKDYRVDPATVKSLITTNTVAIVGSAGNYPHGLIDPLEELSDIALQHDLGFHVDGCLGGFILPWIERLGYKVPPFDFRLPGLTSMSADTHKFGYGPKGTSVVLYRNKSLRRYQYFHVPDWPGGIYMSPSITGSRSGGLLAATWAAMVYLGEDGYLRAARSIMKVAGKIRKGIESIPELEIIGDPTFVVSFRSQAVDIYHVNDFMSERGWRFNTLQAPPALHFCVTMPQTLVPQMPDQLTRDLKEAVKYAKTMEGTKAKTSALYGISASVEGHQQLREILYGTFDYLLDPG